MTDKPFQTRSEENGLRGFDTLPEAKEAAEKDRTIWKISFWDNQTRIRLVKDASDRWHDVPLGDG